MRIETDGSLCPLRVVSLYEEECIGQVAIERSVAEEDISRRERVYVRMTESQMEVDDRCEEGNGSCQRIGV